MAFENLSFCGLLHGLGLQCTGGDTKSARATRCQNSDQPGAITSCCSFHMSSPKESTPDVGTLNWNRTLQLRRQLTACQRQAWATIVCQVLPIPGRSKRIYAGTLVISIPPTRYRQSKGRSVSSNATLIRNDTTLFTETMLRMWRRTCTKLWQSWNTGEAMQQPAYPPSVFRVELPNHSFEMLSWRNNFESRYGRRKRTRSNGSLLEKHRRAICRMWKIFYF